jgi:ADP-heptose:LPS heptosyltransferase
MQQKKNILLIKHGAFGDLIQSDGIFKSIKIKHPKDNLILLTTSSFKNLMGASPYFDDVIVDNRFPLWNLMSYYYLIKKLNSYNFSNVYDLQNSQRTLGYKTFLLKNALWVTTKRMDHPQSGLQGLIDMLKDNGMANHEIYDPDITWMVNDVSPLLKRKNISEKYVVLIPGSSKNHPEKRWPFYKNIAKEFMDQGFDVVNILGPDELSLHKDLLGHKLELLEWGDLAGVINSSLFVIGNDSGPSHIASCLKKSGLALFGPTTSGAKSELARPPFRIIETENLEKFTTVDLTRSIKEFYSFLK